VRFHVVDDFCTLALLFWSASRTASGHRSVLGPDFLVFFSFGTLLDLLMTSLDSTNTPLKPIRIAHIPKTPGSDTKPSELLKTALQIRSTGIWTGWPPRSGLPEAGCAAGFSRGPDGWHADKRVTFADAAESSAKTFAALDQENKLLRAVGTDWENQCQQLLLETQQQKLTIEAQQRSAEEIERQRDGALARLRAMSGTVKNLRTNLAKLVLQLEGAESAS
jgi:hypothetical protein